MFLSSIAVTQRAGQDLAFVMEEGKSIPENRLTLKHIYYMKESSDEFNVENNIY